MLIDSYKAESTALSSPNGSIGGLSTNYDAQVATLRLKQKVLLRQR